MQSRITGTMPTHWNSPLTPTTTIISEAGENCPDEQLHSDDHSHPVQVVAAGSSACS